MALDLLPVLPAIKGHSPGALQNMAKHGVLGRLEMPHVVQAVDPMGFRGPQNVLHITNNQTFMTCIDASVQDGELLSLGCCVDLADLQGLQFDSNYTTSSSWVSP